MKTKITKIFLLTLTLALAIGMAVGFTASAEGEAVESVAIVSQNVEYGGQTHLYFAVKYENVANPEKIALNVSYVDSNGESKDVTITESETVTLKDSEGNDVVCRAFRTPGVDAKSFTHKFVAQAVTEAGTESAEKTYSVTEYCLEMITYISTLDAPTDKLLKVKAACESTLAYGTDIQALLGYYPAENDYPENYVYVKGTNGVKVNGADAACVINATEIALTYEGTETRIGWEVADVAGNEITVTDDKFSATASCIAAPGLSDATGEYFLAKQAGTVTGSTWDYDTLTTVSSDNIGSAANGSITISDGSLYLDDGDQENAAMSVKFYNGTVAACTIFEFDFKLAQSYGSWPIQLKIANIQYTIYYTTSYDSSYGTGHKLCILANGVYVPLGFETNEWGTLRFEHYYDEAVLKVFVNNEFLVDITTSTGSTKQSNIIYLTTNERNTGSNADLYLDNIYVGNIDKAFVAGDPNATPAE